MNTKQSILEVIRIMSNHEQTLWVLVKEWGGLKVATNFFWHLLHRTWGLYSPLGLGQLWSLYPMIKWCYIWFRVLVLRCRQLPFPVPWKLCCKETSSSCKNLAIQSPSCCEEAQVATWEERCLTSAQHSRHLSLSLDMGEKKPLDYSRSWVNIWLQLHRHPKWEFPSEPTEENCYLKLCLGCLLYSNR